MSLIKAIEHGKEHRRPYRGIQECFAACRPHGGCNYSLSNRLHSVRKRILACEQDIAALNDPPTQINSVKASRPWAVPSGISRDEARRNLILLTGEYVFEAPALDDLLDDLLNFRVGRQGKTTHPRTTTNNRN